MDETGHSASSEPVFSRCVQCGYSLRGLPAEHACPECGLRYDLHCGLYRVRNPKASLVFWLLIFSGGMMNLRFLPSLFRWQYLGTSDRFMAVVIFLWLIMICGLALVLYRRYRRGELVAVTAEGLFIRLSGFEERLHGWDEIGEVGVKPVSEGKPQVARVHLRSRRLHTEIGGLANVFPTRADVERFVEQVKHHRVGTEGSP